MAWLAVGRPPDRLLLERMVRKRPMPEVGGRYPFQGTIAARELPLTDFRDGIVRLFESRITAAAMSAASLHIEKRGEVPLEWAGGRLDFNPSASPATPESVFLIASITKPMSCAAVVTLIEQGRIDLDDRVAAYIPEFGANGKEAVRLRHCFTHTSGLLDRLPDNLQLRRENAPIESFVASTCRTHLRFPPGTDIKYQSTGISMLANVAERVTGERFRDLLEKKILRPAGMDSTHLGWREDFEQRAVATKIHDRESSRDWNLDSAYWRDFGAPWGGAHATAADIGRFLQVMLEGGRSANGDHVLRPGSARLMLADHISAMPQLPEAVRLREGWGLGWRIQRLGDGSWCGSAVPAGAFGHWGITGTVAWADPVSGVSFVLLTNGSFHDEGDTLKRCGNIAAGALCGSP